MMIQRLVVVLLVLMVVFVGCGGDESGKPMQKTKKITKDSPKKITWDKDGAEMVLIPEDFEETGDSYDEFGDLVPSKVVKVLDPFYMDTTEVTVGQFKKFLKSSGYKPKEPIDWDKLYEYSPTDDHPMIYVNWYDATAYAKWAGKRLPTEKEREFADWGGLFNKEFPWGDDESIAREYANFSGTEGTDQWQYIAPVGSLKPNGYGLYDMAGNVSEWCEEGKDTKVLRGGSWDFSTAILRVANRSIFSTSANADGSGNGFRCVSGSK